MKALVEGRAETHHQAPFTLYKSYSGCELCRPYEKLQEFYVGEDSALLSWKLSTKKRLQCNGLHCINPGQLGSYRLICLSMDYF